ncbi:MAG: HAMP domain-containing histidine kinase [Lachnospiraceae bacterium]|jgi:signal transduction histidine kinase|nr:HAMP domain-containing histidine kinase [Lachnospiraceae bacterium]
MRKSYLLRKIVLLLLLAVLLSGILTAGIYILFTQKMYVSMRAQELTPIARTLADMLSGSGTGVYGTQSAAPSITIENNYNFRPLMVQGNRNFLGASLHIYNVNGVSLNEPQVIFSQRNDGRTIESQRPIDGANSAETQTQSDSEELTSEQAKTLLQDDLITVLSGKEVSAVRKSGNYSYLVVGVPIIYTPDNETESQTESQSGNLSKSNTIKNVFPVGENETNDNAPVVYYSESEGVAEGVVIGAVFFTKSMNELQDSLNGLNLTLIVSTLASFLIMLIPTYFAVRRLVIPIRQMREVAHSMADGDFSVRADASQKGEIGELARSMNHFAEASGQLEQTRRDYVANVSHELRTPIASIRAMGETLQDGMVKNDEKKVLFYQNIVRESMRLSRLVDDLLELSRLQSATEAMKKTEFDLREVLQNIADTYGHLAVKEGKDFAVLNDLEEAIPVISNPDRLEQVLIILLDNAFKYVDSPGEIRVGIIKSEKNQNNKTGIYVSNTGETISNEDLPHIFERFYMADKAHTGGGTGLGLSIAKEIIDGLNETISVSSENGLTKFELTVENAS